MRSKSVITEKWKQETIKQAKALSDRTHEYMRGQAHGMQIVAQMVKGMKREYSPIDYESSRNKTIRTLGRKLKELENAYNKALDDILERLGFDKENEV